ncbi:MAG: ABC transporter permease [Candidatus Omnitrophica bacterium]|nr:ABC transporter permease [Candidatus Omnitrophota bacterium]
MENIITDIGKWVEDVLEYAGKITILLIHSIEGIFTKKISHNLLMQMEEIGVNSFPLVSLISIFTGMVMVMETVKILSKFGGEIFAGVIVSVSMIRELGPVIVALIVAGRIGASISAEIGSMKITEQIDALEVLAVDPVKYLVSPRLLASMVMMPFLNLIAVFLSIMGGFIVAVYIVHLSPVRYMHQSLDFITVKDVFVSITKSFVFGILIIIASCFEGLNATGGAEGVGKATTRAVVSSFFLIILSNLILTAIFYFIK